jgi:hypothetical protein
MTFGVASIQAPAGTCAGRTPGELTSLNGYVPFPVSNLWNTDISTAPVDPNSANSVHFIEPNVTLHADFGSSKYAGQHMGIPYQIVTATPQTLVPVKLGAYASRDDRADAHPVEHPHRRLSQAGQWRPSCWCPRTAGAGFYELGNAHLTDGNWSADAAAVFDVIINEQRPWTWTSANAAGLSIFAGLVRYDEVAAGAIDHALRFTIPQAQEAFTPPASHWASSIANPDAPTMGMRLPMGMRLRLKASFDISGFSAVNPVILTAVKHYGLILADNSSAVHITGAPNDRWNNEGLHNLGSLTASDFEVVQMSEIIMPANVPTGLSPKIATFTANPTAPMPGQMVTLSWSVSGSEYNIITPLVGPVRGTSVVPVTTTTYTLESTNQFGRARKTVTVTVQ